MKKSQFKLYQHGRKTGKRIYYVQFRLPDGSWSSAKSTGSKNKKEAVHIAESMLRLSNSPPFASFATGFFDYDGEWAKEQRITGRRNSERQCRDKQRLLDTHVIPHLGDIEIALITETDIEELRNSLFGQYAGTTVNKVLSCINTVFEYARKKSTIEKVPKVLRASQRGIKRKGVLTPTEATAVLQKINWKDDRARIMCLLASATGMRAGEILALQIKDIARIKNIGVIDILRSWDRQGLKHNDTTKTGYYRYAPVSASILKEIDALIQVNPHRAKVGDNAFVFFARDMADRPMRPEKIDFYYYAAMRAVGILEEERKARNITFHSWRYYANSFMLNEKITLQKVQKLLGHMTDDMSFHYYESTIESMSDVLEAQEAMIKMIQKEDKGKLLS